jgi:hypothetical protein
MLCRPISMRAHTGNTSSVCVAETRDSRLFIVHELLDRKQLRVFNKENNNGMLMHYRKMHAGANRKHVVCMCSGNTG